MSWQPIKGDCLWCWNDNWTYALPMIYRHIHPGKGDDWAYFCNHHELFMVFEHVAPVLDGDKSQILIEQIKQSREWM